jgi:very-long-chain enoyl-CoA reductase
LKDAGVVEGGELSVKDLGPQVSWKTVFLVEYVSVSCISWLSLIDTSSLGWPVDYPPSHLLLPWVILWRPRATQYASTVCANMASMIMIMCSHAISYVFAFVLLHFAKRELETLFVHRFSHATMPFMNIFKKYAF